MHIIEPKGWLSGSDDVGVGFSLNPALSAMLPRWMAEDIRKAGKDSTVQGLAFEATMWLKGYGRLPEFGLPTSQKEDTQRPSRRAPPPNDPFWKTTEQRANDRNDALAHPRFGQHTTHSNIFSDTVKAVEKIPVLGDVTKIVDEATTAPFKIAERIASGERLDHVAMDSLKDQIKIAKDVAPYATTVVALVPGIGTTAAAAIAVGAALAEGKSIDQATKDAIRAAIPGGVLAQAAFDVATKVAAGESVTQAALETARSQLPPGPQQAAFDIGTAVITGQKLQTALAKGLADVAPEGLQKVLDAGQNAISTVPGLSDALKKLPPGAAEQGFKIAAGLLSHKGINEKALTEVRNHLPADAVPGFDAALKTQESHTPWLKNVTSTPALHAAPLKALSAMHAAKKVTPKPSAPGRKYAPYPKHVTGTAGVDAPPPHHGGGGGFPRHGGGGQFVRRPFGRGGFWGGPWWGGPWVYEVVTATTTCRTWGDPIQMSPEMQTSAKAALGASGGRPTTVRGPDGGLYLFTYEGGALTARPCVAVGAA